VISACQNGVHPNLAASTSTMDQTCFTQTLVKLDKRDTIHINTTTNALEAGTGTFFGMIKMT